MNKTHCNTGDTHCITCGDAALVATVVSTDDLTMMAVVVMGEETTEVDISLIENVAVGDTLWVHGGVALGEAADKVEMVDEWQPKGRQLYYYLQV